MSDHPLTEVHPDAIGIWNRVWPEHRFNQPNDHVRLEWLSLMSAALAERDAKLKAIEAVVHRWVDSKDRSLDSGGGMVKVLEILYPTPLPTGDKKGTES